MMTITPKNFKTPAELMKSWTIENLFEYRDVLTEKYNELQMTLYNLDPNDFMRKFVIDNEIAMTKNRLVVCLNELEKRQAK